LLPIYSRSVNQRCQALFDLFFQQQKI